MNDSSPPADETIKLEPSSWLVILVIGTIVSAGFLLERDPTAAKIVHSIFLCGHLFTFCCLLLYGILVQMYAKDGPGFRIWKLVIPCEAWVAFCIWQSCAVIFAVRWIDQMVLIATIVSGIGFLLDLGVLYLLTPQVNGEARSPRGLIRAVREMVRGFQRAPWVEKYNALIASENYREALELLQPELKRKHPDAMFLIAAGSLHLQLDQTDEGIRLLQDGLSKSDRDANTLATVAWIYHVHDRLDLGQPLLDEAFKKDDRNLTVSLIRCQFLISAGHLDEARELWSQVKDTTDPSVQSWLKEPVFQKGIERLNAPVDSVTPS